MDRVSHLLRGMAQFICDGLANVLPFLDYGNVKCVESSFPCRRALLFQRGRLDNSLELLKHVCMPLLQKPAHGLVLRTRETLVVKYRSCSSSVASAQIPHSPLGASGSCQAGQPCPGHLPVLRFRQDTQVGKDQMAAGKITGKFSRDSLTGSSALCGTGCRCSSTSGLQIARHDRRLSRCSRHRLDHRPASVNPCIEPAGERRLATFPRSRFTSFLPEFHQSARS